MAQVEMVRTKGALHHFQAFTLIVCLLCFGKLVGQEPASAPLTDPIALVTVDPSKPGKPVPAGFLGFSHEWGQAQLLMGDSALGSNAIYRQLLSNLLSYNHHLVIRVGGSSTDKNRRADSEMIGPLAALFTDFSKTQPQLSFILGVNFGANDPALTSQQIKAFVAGMPVGSISAFELGHQPDRYTRLKYRTEPYGFSEYLNEVNKLAEEIKKAVPAAPRLMGPSNSGSAASAGALTVASANFRSLASFQKIVGFPSLGVGSQHSYLGASTKCGGNPTPGSLLEASASTENARLMEPFVKAAHAAGKPFRITELNTFTCGGEQGISNAFESALWASDILFEYAQAGVNGVNIHSNNWNTNSNWDLSGAFLFEVPEAQFNAAKTGAPPADHQFSEEYKLKAVLPLYYGILLFAEATADQATLLPVQLSSAGNIKAWATLDEKNGLAKVILINKDQQLLGKVKVTVTGYTTASVKRLMGPSFRSQNGITYGGLTFDGSTDGRPIGKEEREELKVANDATEVAMGPTSALIITFKK